MLFLWILYDAIKFHVFSGVVNSGLGKKKIMASYAIVSCASTNNFHVIIMSNIMIINNISAVGKAFVLSLSPKLNKVDKLHMHF